MLQQPIYNPNVLGAELSDDKFEKFDWLHLTYNRNAVPILEKFSDKLEWDKVCCNVNAVGLIEKNLDKLNGNN